MVMDQTELHEQMALLHEEYLASIPDKITQLTEQIDQLVDGEIKAEPLRQLQYLSHTLKGSSGTFGLPELARIAKLIEQQSLILSEATDTLQSTASLQAAAKQLKDFGQQLTAESTTPARDNSEKRLTSPSSRHLLFLIEGDSHQAAELKSQLHHCGYATQCFKSTTEAKKALQLHTPAALIINLALPEGALVGPELVQQLQLHSDTDSPLIFISARGDWQARYQALQAGGNAFITKPIDIAVLNDTLQNLLRKKDDEPYRVLIVEDDPLLAKHYQLTLTAAGIQTVFVCEPEKALAIAARHQPELILMDLNMGNIDGINLAQVIRQHQQLLSIPIVFLSAEKETELQRQAILSGDHFIEKPISENHLVELVLNRCRRSRSLAAMMHQDGLTGLLNQITMRHRLETELAQHVRHKRNLCFIMIDLDHFKQINDKFGHGVGDTVLKSLARLMQSRLRKSDQIGRIGGEEFGIILPDTELCQAFTLADQLRKQFFALNHSSQGIQFHCSFSAGIASSEIHPNSLNLLDAADRQLYQSKQAGRNQVTTEEVTE